MSIEQWWSKVKPSTREWLIENNGDIVPPGIVAEIAASGGLITSDAWWVGQSGPSGLSLSDEATDWIEAVANGEDPETPPSSTSARPRSRSAPGIPDPPDCTATAATP